MKTKMDRKFEAFTLLSPCETMWARFEPTANPERVKIKFVGACGHPMENVIPFDLAVRQVKLLNSKGYKRLPELEVQTVS